MRKWKEDCEEKRMNMKGKKHGGRKREKGKKTIRRRSRWEVTVEGKKRRRERRREEKQRREKGG